MTKYKKIFADILSGTMDQNIKFVDLSNLLLHITKITPHPKNGGDHFIYTVDGTTSIINIQPSNKNHKMAKDYQVRQIRRIIITNGLEVIE